MAIDEELDQEEDIFALSKSSWNPHITTTQMGNTFGDSLALTASLMSKKQRSEVKPDDSMALSASGVTSGGISLKKRRTVTNNDDS